jgi:hypothetical protein
MTISSQVTSVKYTATAGQTNFVGDWRIVDRTDVKVYKNGTLQTIDTHYAITGVGDANFTVVLTAGAALSDTIEIILDPLFEQPIDYKFNDKFPEETHEKGLDKLTLIALSLRENLTSAVLGDNEDLFEEIINRIEILEGSSSPNAASGTFLASGGQVVWVTGLQFTVAAASYYINGVLYTSAQQNITLDAAHATLPRIDAITLNTSGVVGKTTGTPNANPSEPTVDPLTLLKLTIVLVPANAGQPTATNTSLYAENAGDPAEWNWTATHSSINLASTSSPRTATKCIEGTSVPSGQYAQGKKGAGTIDLNTFDRLVLYVRSKGFGTARWINVEWFQDGIKKGNTVLIRNGQWGFNSQNTTDYQVIALDTLLFNIPAGTLVNEIRLRATGTIGFRIDDIFLQTGGTGGEAILPVPGMSQDEADARYQPIINPNNSSEVFLDFTSNTEAGWFQNCGLLNNKVNAPGIAGYINSNNQFGRVPATSAAGVWLPQSGNVAQLEFRGNHGTNGSADHRVGFGNQGFSFPDQHGVWFEHLNADTNWFAVCRSNSVQTRADTGVAWVNQGYLNGSWTKFRIVWTHGTNVKFYINGVLVATISTNIPTQEMWVFFSSTASALNSWWNMDYYWLKFTGLVR